MISGAGNRVRLLVASLPDFVVMKAHSIGGRDKPKDVYDLCFFLASYPGWIAGASRGALPSGQDSEG